MSEEILFNQFITPKSRPDRSYYSIQSPGLKENFGVFVTIQKNEKLRGCIGRTLNNEMLLPSLHQMTIASAFNDHRFDSLSIEELSELQLEISLLSPPVKINNVNDIVLGKHGIIFKKEVDKKIYQSVFLPQVPTNQGWNLEETLSALSTKSGLSRDAWKDMAKFEVFEGIHFRFE
jgi:AmmeMemoRadiSam system protein A